MPIYQLFLYLKQLRKDYFLEEYAFINSNSDFNPYPIIADNSEKKCLLCKSNSKPDEIITLSSEITVKLENYAGSNADDISLDQCGAAQAQLNTGRLHIAPLLHFFFNIIIIRYYLWGI